MHSRIFGIIKKEEYEALVREEGIAPEMPVSAFEENLPEIMDYVNGDTDFDADFDWLITHLHNRASKFEYDPSTHIIKLQAGFKEEYFEKSWKQIKELLETPNAFDGFCNGLSGLVYQLTEAINDRYGFYVCNEHGWYDTMDDFIRYADINTEYVVFGSIDYHW